MRYVYFILGLIFLFSIIILLHFFVGKSLTDIGTILAGFFTAISAFLLFFTLKAQKDSNEKTAFEARFFEMIKYHRENVSEMKYLTPDSDGKNWYEGKKVFIKIHLEIETLIEEIKDVFDGTEYYKCECSRLKDSKNSIIINRKIDLDKLNLYNIAYLIVFMGVSKRGIKILKKIFNDKYKEDFCSKILDRCIAKPVKYSKYYSLWDKDRQNWNRLYKTKKYVKYYGGHQIRLGHYFRHLFQSVKYVNEINLVGFNYKNRYEYIKILRAQLSTYEQAILFFNSLSIGRIWEFDIDENDVDLQLITKYNLITNIPSEFITSIRFQEYYPNVEFEGSVMPIKRKILEQRYL